MSMFEDVTLTWDGKTYVVPSDRVMGLIETVECHVTLEDLQSSGVKRAHLSRAFTAALRYAGARSVLEEHVYNLFFDTSSSAQVQMVITSLLMMMIPPEHLRSTTPKAKPTPKKRKKKAA